MTIGLLFWIVFIIGMIFCGYRDRSDLRGWASDTLIYWLLVGLLGIGVFGWPIK